jgi:predicted metal-dependent peptidase
MGRSWRREVDAEDLEGSDFDMKPIPSAEETLARIERGLRMVTVPLPHLAGLAAAVRTSIDDRVPTMGVFASGRMVANRQFVAKLRENELIFVLAHELLHLALRTHDRAKGSGRLEFNYAHDYIINDILRAELGFTHVPAGGLDMPGAKEKSAEQIVIEMRRDGDKMKSKTQVWNGQETSARGALGRSGQGQPDNDEAGDVMDDAKERELFPECRNGQRQQKANVEREAAKSASLGKAMGKKQGRGVDAGDVTQTVMAMRGMYKTPWEAALQKWIESVAPGERTYLRPSRREVAGDDVVLAGRKRESWMLNVVLDTSGSMSDEIPRALGAIADFCEQLSVDEIRLMQCDVEVTGDEMLSPQTLANYQVSGFGGSDLTPAMRVLAEDGRVTAAVVITDGDIAFPPEEMPYDVLWVVTQNVMRSFNPPYGRIVRMQGGRA